MGYAEMAKAAMDSKAAKILTPEFREFRQEGEMIVGRYKGKGTIPAKEGKPEYNQYVFDTDDGPVKFSLGSNADREEGLMMQIGRIYAITFLGKEKLEKNKTVNKWSIAEIPGDALDEPELPE